MGVPGGGVLKGLGVKEKKGVGKKGYSKIM